MKEFKVYPHQQSVFEELAATARVFFSDSWRCYPVKPRFARFIAGPTGTGKTHLVRVLAESMKLPLFTISAPFWIPVGCSERGARTTWMDILDFCRRNERGIIFLDELDKLHSGMKSAYVEFIRPEVFMLIDRVVPDNVLLKMATEPEDWNGTEETPDDIERLVRGRLATGIFLIAAGAFQHRWKRTPARTIGFGAETTLTVAPTIGKRQMQEDIPPELANRFVGPILSIPSLKEADYWAMLERLLPQLPEPLRTNTEVLARKSVLDAVAGGLGCRWVEEVMLGALLRTQQKHMNSHKLPLVEHSPTP